MGFFYYSKVEFTTVNTFSNVTGFSHFTMVNTDLVCCGGNGGRMKAKFTIVNSPKKSAFITKSARRQRTCMYVRIVRDISLIFNEFKDAPL